ncbi:MAG: hypothetical protein HKN39_03765 [Flavobacteriales bacterium]|nr:hypothetical protein [Flavobacteriales bacterium]
MLPAAISRNVLLSLITSLVIGLIAIIYAFFFPEFGPDSFSPTMAEGLQVYFQSHKMIGFLVVLFCIALTGLFWNSKMNDGEILIQEDFSQLYNLTFICILLYFICPVPVIFISILFYSLGVGRVFKLNKNTDTAFSISFDAGLFIGLATYFNLTSIFFLLFIWIGIMIIRSITPRDIIWSLLGLALPFLFMSGIDQLFGTNLVHFPNSIISGTSWGEFLNWKLLTFVGLGFFVLITGYFALAQNVKRSSIRYKYSIQALNVFFLFTLLQGIVMAFANSWDHFLFALLFPIAFYWHCNSCGKDRYVFNNVLYLAWVVVIVLCIV